MDSKWVSSPSIFPAFLDALGLDQEWRGRFIFMGAGGCVRRIAVFLDYQNVYMAARRAFFDQQAPHALGQIDPLRLGTEIAGRCSGRVEHPVVRVYRGLPQSTHDPVGAGAALRQVDRWSREERVTVVTRPLRYRQGVPPVEKGIDVRLAIDLVAMALRDEYDTAVLFSADSDLLPAIEEVGRAEIGKTIDVASWKHGRGPVQRLRHSKDSGLPQPWCHFLDRDAYERVSDRTDYVTRRTRRR